MTDPVRDHGAERYVLGSMMTSSRVLDDIVDVVTAADFDDPRHELIFSTILAAHAQNAPRDPVAILDRLGSDARRVGGAPYLNECYQAPVTAANGDYFARIVADKAVLRRLQHAADRIRVMTEADGDLDEIVAAARAEVDAAANRRTGDLVMLADSIWETISGLEEGTAKPTPTPWPDLDHLIGGLRPGALYVVGARPGRGKSVIGAMLALDTARRGKVAAVSSLEMSRAELNLRWIAQAGRVPMDRLMRPDDLTKDDYAAMGDVAQALSRLPIAVDDRPAQTLWSVRHHARSASRRGELGVIVVDYLQLMLPPRTSRAQRHEQVAEMSRGLKILAKEMRVPVVALSQLNRKSEERDGKRPSMADLRESGAVEQDADVIMLLHRDEEQAPDVLEVDVPKNRHGRTGVLSLLWQGRFSRALPLEWTPSAAVAS